MQQNEHVLAWYQYLDHRRAYSTARDIVHGLARSGHYGDSVSWEEVNQQTFEVAHMIKGMAFVNLPS